MIQSHAPPGKKKPRKRTKDSIDHVLIHDIDAVDDVKEFLE
jgi:hypothetical protein